MLKEEGLLNEEAEKEMIASYDFTTLTASNKSVIKFKDMDHNIVSKIIPLFAHYTVWPVILWPLIDLVKNDEKNGEFTKLLWSKINTITYFKKYKEWPEKHTFYKATKELESDYDFNNKTANEFVKLLIDNWGENFKEKIKEMLSLIKKWNLKPEFPIPQNEEELRSFLGVNKTSVDEKRKMRQRLRAIAKEDSVVYETI